MNEFLTNQPERERTESEVKQAEADNIAEILGNLYEAAQGEITAEDAWDWSHTALYELIHSLAKRDSELGALIVNTIESHQHASRDQGITDPLREELGLPVRDAAYWAQRDQHEADQPSTPAPES